MKFSEAHGTKIVSTETAETVGEVDGFVVDPSDHAVRALRVRKSNAGNTLAWSDIRAFGVDAVTVDRGERIRDAGGDVSDLLGKERQILGKRVLTTGGEELGSVSDIDFDPDSGEVTSLVCGDGDVAGARLVGVGSYAVVVQRS
ncbi:PRC-barrel domain-containing protein [Nocardioides sp. GCM10027113]|uniref:PRC-barrel domain-containing protein n=1 Tax=unclassified Nocardioides TaxID=2615069 RepID=UPI00361C8BC1